MIRAAQPADRPAMARLHVRAWRRAYAEIIDHDALDLVTEASLLESWAQAAPQRRVWVFDQSGTIAGHVALDDGALRMLYVDPPAQGAGVGGRLLETATAAGAHTLRTFAANAPARAFYESRGWLLDGERDDWFGQPVVAYRLPRR